MNMRDLFSGKKKIFTALTSFGTGLTMYLSGDKGNGMAMMLCAVLGYLGAEALCDASSAFMKGKK